MFSETVEISKLFGFIPTHRREAFCGVKSMIFILYSAVLVNTIKLWNVEELQAQVTVIEA